MVLSLVLALICSCLCLNLALGVGFSLPQAQYDALQALYLATNGSGWIFVEPYSRNGYPWQFTTPEENPCSADTPWQGVTCSSDCSTSVCSVLQLDLYQLNLVGHLPPQIGNLTTLQELILEHNSLSQSIPEEIGKLTGLQVFKINNNVLTGTIPSALCNANGFEQLELYYNQFVGTLPDCFGELTSLTYLEANNNYLTGTIPSSYGNLKKLSALILNSNFLNGTLPVSLQKLAKMETVYLYNNLFTGTVPVEYGNWTSLGIFDLSINFFHGQIPDTLGYIQTLNAFYFYASPLSGTLPTTFTSNQFLKSIYIYETNIEGRIPEEWGSLPLIGELCISQNRLTGSIPSTFERLTSLVNFLIYSNQLTGSLPAFSSLVKLGEFVISGNLFSQQIPEGFMTNTEGLTILDLNDNQFSGPFPSSICNISTITQLFLGINEFDGRLPDCEISNAHLAALIVSGNGFTGALPAVWATSADLTYFNASFNFLSGTIPSTYSAATQLIFFDVATNHFSGQIESLFASLPALYDLSLGANFFSGPFPSFSNENHSDLLVDVSENAFTGSLPVHLFQEGRLVSFVASINCFTGSLPTEICLNTNLTDLIVDGLHSASACTQRIFSFSRHATYALDGAIQGSIPGCIMSLPKLEAFHAAGNGWTGTIPVDAAGLGPLLYDLDLSNNALKGQIPTSLQTRQFLTLDLSFNHLDGTLTSDMPGYLNTSMTLHLQVNRLSGGIPASLIDAPNINILQGNLFRCDQDGSNLPEHDPNYDAYQCGSDYVNDALLVWFLSLMLIVVIVVCFVAFCVPDQKIAGTRLFEFVTSLATHGFFHSLVSLNPQFFSRQGVSLAHIHLLGIACRRMLRLLTLVLLYALCALMPLYGILTAVYGTYSFQYVWTVSFAYLSGTTSGVILFCALLVLLEAILLYLWRRRLDPKIELSENQYEARVLLHQNWHWRFAWSVFLAMIDCTIMVAVNAGYVLAVSQELSTRRLIVLSLFLSLFKYVWNSVVVIDLFGKCSERYLNIVLHSSFLWSLGLFNNIVAPYLAEAFVSPDCFFYTLYAPPTVTSTFYGQDCSFQQSFSDDIAASPLPTRSFSCVPEITATGAESSSFGTISVSSITFTPPFLYSYECSSSLLTAFAYVFVYRYLLSGVVQPIALIILKRLQESAFHRAGPFSWSFRVCTFCLPVLLRPLRTSSGSNGTVPQQQNSSLYTPPEIGFTRQQAVQQPALTDNLPRHFQHHGEDAEDEESSSPHPSKDNRTKQQHRDSSADGGGGFRLFDDDTRISGFSDDSSSTNIRTAHQTPSSLTQQTAPNSDPNNPNRTSNSAQSLSYLAPWLQSWSRMSSNPTSFSTKYPLRSTAEINVHLIGQILQQHLYLRKSLTVRLVSDIAVLLTFGVLFPPLAIVVMVSIAADLLTVQIMLGRLVAMSLGPGQDGEGLGNPLSFGGEQDAHADAALSAAAMKELQALRTLVSRLNEACEGFGPGLWKGLAFCSVLSCAFWSFSLFDTIADESTATVPATAVAITILMCLAPLWLRGLNHAVYRLSCACCSTMGRGSTGGGDVYVLGPERTSEMATFQTRDGVVVQNPLARNDRSSDFSSVIVQ